MWTELICGLFIHRIVKRLLYCDEALDFDPSRFDALFAVAKRLISPIILSNFQWVKRLLYGDEALDFDPSRFDALFAVAKRLISPIILSNFQWVKRLLYGDEALDFNPSRFDALFAVAKRLQKLYQGSKVYVGLQIPDFNSATRKNIDIVLVTNQLQKLYQGSKVYVGLQIPDFDSATRKNIDIVLVTNQEAMVISVKNLSGIVSFDGDNNWVCADGKGRKTERLPDPVDETRELVSVLEHYLDQRGVALPDGYLSYKVICLNQNFGFVDPDLSPPEVITQLTQLKPKQRNLYSEWIKGAFRGGKEKTHESLIEKLNFVLSTAPISDRLELEGNKCILGKFLEFKGSQDNVQLLRKIKRSKVSLLTVQKASMFGYDVRVLSTRRDYRGAGSSSSSQREEVIVKSYTEVVFQPQNSKKPHKYKLSSVMSISLSA